MPRLKVHFANHVIEDHCEGGKDNSYSPDKDSGKQAVMCLKGDSRSWQLGKKCSSVERGH